MPATGFARAVDGLLEVSKAHAALFLFGPGLTMPAQRSLKPAGHCGALARLYYQRAIACSFFFVFAAFGSYIVFTHVKPRIPDAADGGLQSLGARERKKLRAYAAVGSVLSLAASVLALFTYSYILQTKLGMLACMPAPVRVAVYATYVVIGVLLSVLYATEGKAVLLAEE